MRVSKAFLALAVMSCAHVAMAQDDKEASEPEKATEGEKAEPEGTEGAEKADEKEEAKPAEKADPTADAAADSPVELPGKTYHFVGLRYRGVIIPKFMMNLFGEGGATVYAHGLGPEFAIRKDGFEYVFSLWWAGYYMDETPFKSSSDPASGWEVVKAELDIVYLTADFLWSQELGPQFSINYGMGAGFGLVFGDLYRTQAYPPSGSASQDPYDWEKCTAPGNPAVGGFCGSDNDHYGGYTEPSWADGGSKPIIFPWLVAQTGFRYKAAKQFVARFDAGFGTSGFFIGLGADYGL